MKIKDNKLLKIISFGDYTSDRKCNIVTLLIFCFVFTNTTFSASIRSGESTRSVAASPVRPTSATSQLHIILCPASFSIFLKGHCVSCTKPGIHLTGVKYDQHGVIGDEETSQRIPQAGLVHLTRTSISSGQVFTCPTDEQMYSELLKIQRGRQFLNGNLLRIVTIERPPFVHMVNNKFTGVVFELLQSLELKYNFTSKTFLPFDGNWGNVKNGTWNGMVGQVLAKDADLGAAGFSVTLERAKVIDFSRAFHQEPTAILIPAPTAGNQLTVLVRPLSGEVWLAVFVTVCVLVPSLCAMHILSLRLRRKASNNMLLYKPIRVSRLIGELIQFIIGSLVQEGMISPVNKTSRVVVVLWWFLTLVLANIYVGYMVSYLSAPKLFDVVDSLEGLLHQTVLRWTYRKNTALQDLFQSNTSGVYKAIGMGAQETDLSATDNAGVEKVLRGDFAFIKERSFLDVAVGSDFESHKQCRLTIAEKSFFTVGLALIVQKGCAFLELLDKEILNVVTSGLMEKWKSIHWPRHLWCVNAAQYIISTQPKVRKLTWDDCQGAYFLLLCGLSLAAIAFIWEIRAWKCFLGRRKPTTTTTTTFHCGECADNNEHNLRGYKIIVIPVKEDIYHKIHKLNLFKAFRKGVIDKPSIG